MRPYLFQFRELFHELTDGAADHAALIAEWAPRNAAILQPFEVFQNFNAPDNPYEVTSEDLWSFCALSRVCDTLIENFEPPLESVPANAKRGNFSLAQFVGFWKSIGVFPSEVGEYHPFWCEIAAIEAADSPDAPPQIEEVFWPALTFGNLLICRAGVRVRAGSDVLNSRIAATSPLYFTFRRANRKAHDLSHGWGHNSQWRTSFRRDYLWDEAYIFNADGALEMDQPPFLSGQTPRELEQLLPHHLFLSQSGDDSGLSESQREELLTNRCFVRHQTDDDDFWPYDDTLLLQIKSV